MNKLIDAIDEKVSNVNKMYFGRLLRDYIVKNCNNQISMEYFAEYATLTNVETLCKVLAEEEMALIRLFSYLNGETTLKQEEDDRYPSMITSYDIKTFYKYMERKKHDFEDCLKVICVVQKDNRMFLNEKNRREYDAKNILTNLSVYFFMVDIKEHDLSIGCLTKFSDREHSMYKEAFPIMLKKYRMMVLQCIHTITGSIGRLRDFIKKITAHNKSKKDVFETCIEEYLQIKELDDKRIMDEENRKLIDATRPTQKEVVLSEKFVQSMSLRPIRDIREEKVLFKRMVLFKINQWFKEKLTELQKEEEIEFE